MSDGSEHTQSREEPTPGQTIMDPRQQGLNLPLPPALQSLVELERQRIESFNKRTEVVRYAIETNDAADKRQYEFQMAKLTADTNAGIRRHSLMRALAIGGGLILTVFVGTLLGIAFYGTPIQSNVALDVLKYMGTGAAGYGILNGLQALLRRLSN